MKEAITIRAKRSQRDHNLDSKLAVIDQVKKWELIYKKSHAPQGYKEVAQSQCCVANMVNWIGPTVMRKLSVNRRKTLLTIAQVAGM